MVGLDDGYSDLGGEATCARIQLALGQHEASLQGALTALGEPPICLAPHGRSQSLVLAAKSVPAHDPRAKPWLAEAISLTAHTGATLVRAEALQALAEHDRDHDEALSRLREAAALLGPRASLRFAVWSDLALRLALGGHTAEALAQTRALAAAFDPRAEAPLEGPSVLATAARAAAAAGDGELAAALRARAEQRHRAILLGLTEPAWRVGYATRLRRAGSGEP